MTMQNTAAGTIRRAEAVLAAAEGHTQVVELISQAAEPIEGRVAI